MINRRMNYETDAVAQVREAGGGPGGRGGFPGGGGGGAGVLFIWLPWRTGTTIESKSKYKKYVFTINLKISKNEIERW